MSGPQGGKSGGGGGEGGRVEWGGSGSEVSGSFTFVFSCPAAGSTLGFFALLGTPREEGERVAEWSGVAQGVRCPEVSTWEFSSQVPAIFDMPCVF